MRDTLNHAQHLMPRVRHAHSVASPLVFMLVAQGLIEVSELGSGSDRAQVVDSEPCLVAACLVNEEGVGLSGDESCP